MRSEEFYMTDMHAYRGWRPTYDGDGNPVLRSVVHQSHMWKPGINTGTCWTRSRFSLLQGPVGEHDSPTMSCDCGYWGYSDPVGKLSALLDAGYRSEAYVTGVIRMSGRVRVDTRGYRSQHAEVVALAPRRSLVTSSPLHTSDNRFGRATLAELGERYRVPVFDSFLDMIAAYPPVEQSTEETVVMRNPMLVNDTRHVSSDGRTVGYIRLVAHAYTDGSSNVTCYTRDNDLEEWRDVGPIPVEDVEEWIRIVERLQIGA